MKIPTPKKLPSGNYFIRLRLSGQEIGITRPTARECKREAELIKAEHRADKRPITPAASKTLGEAIDRYIAARKGVRSPSTLRGYQKIRSTHFQQYMGRPIKSIKWQEMVTDDMASYSAKSVKNAWSLVSSALKEAGTLPPVVLLPQTVQNARPWLEPDQILIFIDAIRGDLCEAAALLGLHSLRMSEILGLRWKDVDVKKGVLHIRGAVVIGENDKPVRKDTNKNLTSRRDVPIMIPRLKELLSAGGDPGSPVVPYVDATIYNHITTACIRAGLPKVSPHGLRHSFASLAYHIGMSERECMEIGGWASPAVMQSVYTHIAAVDRLKTQNKMAAFFGQKNENGNENGNENPKTP